MPRIQPVLLAALAVHLLSSFACAQTTTERVVEKHFEEILGLIGFLGVLIALFGVPLWYKHRTRQHEIELKRDMIAQGMSADDIQRVLVASSSAKISKTP